MRHFPKEVIHGQPQQQCGYVSGQKDGVMRKKKATFIIGFLSWTFIIALLSCAADKAPRQIENSLPQSEIAYFDDSFDSMREDLWDPAGYIHKQEQIQNFKLADMHFESGKLIIRTKTGSFSKGGLGSSFKFRGDFDIQMDCRINFLKGAQGMDQLLQVMVLETNRQVGKADFVDIVLFMKEGGFNGRLNSRGFVNRRWLKSYPILMDNFDGTLRFERKDKNISTYFKYQGEATWNKMRTFKVTDNEMMLGFHLRNYFIKRTRINAEQSVTAEFDNFKINAAHQIIEGEI